MKYIVIFFTILLLAVLCGAGLAIAGWLNDRPADEPAVPPTLDPSHLPTPTVAAGSTNNPPASPTSPPAVSGFFNGSFAGTLTGSGGSSAPVMLELTQNGTDVTGMINIGRGLVIDGGNCGSQEVPPGTQTANGRIDPSNPNHLEATAAFQVQGLAISILLSADMSADGQTLTTSTVIDLPFLCGPDPLLSGSFTRQ